MISGIVMGLGISFMHYLGMIAMNTEATLVYDLKLFILSIIIAIIASFAAMYLFSISTTILDKLYMKLGAALIMAVAVTSMHYTGMIATQVYVIGDIPLHHHEHSTNVSTITSFVTFGIFCLISLSFAVSKLDKYVDHRVKNFDAVTNLPNQNQFTEDNRTLKNCKMIAIVQIHHLEQYISTFGYQFTDELILKMYSLLDKYLPKDTIVYRTEGNRFTIMPAHNDDTTSIYTALEEICAVLKKQQIVAEKFISVEITIAVSSSEKASDIQGHFSNALAILQADITNSQNKVIHYDSKIHTFNFDRQLVNDVDQSLANNEFFIVYQPKVNPTTDSLTGLEALIRWQHPIYGFISPAVFVPILEKANKIADVTDWVIDQVCEQIADWNSRDGVFQQVSINIPGSYITSPNLVSVLNKSILKHRIAPAQIELEITETSVIHNIRNAIKAVKQFRSHGFSVALDDFGTGLSSLSYLKEIPISTIKIDKSFIDGVPHSKKDASILNAIVLLSASLDLNVVIEGVETEEQLAFIRTIDSLPTVQGYYYSKPLIKEELESWMERHSLAHT